MKRLVPLLCILSFGPSTGWILGQAPPETPAMSTEIHLSRADRELMDRVLEESRVETKVPRPSVAAYVLHVLESFMERLLQVFHPLGRYAGGTVSALIYAARVVVIVAILLVIWTATRFLARRRRQKRTDSVSYITMGEGAQDVPRLGERDWRNEIDRRLDCLDVMGSLEATWWWLAHRLVGSDAQAAWTSRELLASAGRSDLAELMSALERMRYGCRAPSASEVRGLVARLEENVV